MTPTIAHPGSDLGEPTWNLFAEWVPPLFYTARPATLLALADSGGRSLRARGLARTGVPPLPSKPHFEHHSPLGHLF
jgi:hypothetical protein